MPIRQTIVDYSGNELSLEEHEGGQISVQILPEDMQTPVFIMLNYSDVEHLIDELEILKSTIEP